mmetsp:Transcript_43816/g.115148  ORF Transcript_43816/g.115148 Transcript_43816/m.115148 type:complete len:119 (+) Transcript_43816:1729-2085(+)
MAKKMEDRHMNMCETEARPEPTQPRWRGLPAAMEVFDMAIIYGTSKCATRRGMLFSSTSRLLSPYHGWYLQRSKAFRSEQLCVTLAEQRRSHRLLKSSARLRKMIRRLACIAASQCST